MWGPDGGVEWLGGNGGRLCELLKHVGIGLAQTTFGLAEVGVGHACLLGKLPQRELSGGPLLLEVVAQRLDGLGDLALCHASSVLTKVSKIKPTSAEVARFTNEIRAIDW